MKRSLPLVALVFGLLGGALVSSCGPAKKVCTPTTCSGCCDGATGACVSVPSNQACGSRGETCKSCTLGQVCSFGSCMGGNNTGAGASGGGFITSGGSAGGGSAAGGAAGGGDAGGAAAGGGVAGGGAAGGGFVISGGSSGGGVVGGGPAGGPPTGGGVTGGGSAGCNSANCGSGCCQGTVCVMPPSNSSNTTCGFAGLACSNCTALGGICNQTTLICEPGTGGGSAGGGTAVGDSCTSPAVLVLSGGSGSTSGSLTGLANDSTQCSGAGPDAVYSVTVTSTGTLQASVTAVGFTPRISIRSTCTGTPLACDANPISGIAQTSTTVSPGTYFIWIDSSVSGAGGSYSLLVSTSGGAGGGSAGGGSAGGGSPAGGSAGGGSAGSYTKSVITASCDTITSGTIESAAIADDAATTQATLPISFSFFGLPMTSYTVSSNGLMQVWTGSGLGDEDSSNPASFITNPTPGGIAPFWDDLDVNPSTSLRSQVLGTGTTRRFVVEWIDWGFYASGTSSTADRLRFQAKLFENGVIEFHYCSMVGTGAITGTSATIGIGDGVVNEVIHGSTVSSGTGLRFTP